MPAGQVVRMNSWTDGVGFKKNRRHIVFEMCRRLWLMSADADVMLLYQQITLQRLC